LIVAVVAVVALRDLAKLPLLHPGGYGVVMEGRRVGVVARMGLVVVAVFRGVTGGGKVGIVAPADLVVVVVFRGGVLGTLVDSGLDSRPAGTTAPVVRRLFVVGTVPAVVAFVPESGQDRDNDQSHLPNLHRHNFLVWHQPISWSFVD
jgi:hypothetical protein